MTEPTPLKPGKFIGGPLDGKHEKVPEYGPPLIRYWEDEIVCHWYAIRRGTKRTYTYAGFNMPHFEKAAGL